MAAAVIGAVAVAAAIGAVAVAGVAVAGVAVAGVVAAVGAITEAAWQLARFWAGSCSLRLIMAVTTAAQTTVMGTTAAAT